MTNEEKAKELYEIWLNTSKVQGYLRQMAQWKDEQFEKMLSEIICSDSPKDTANELRKKLYNKLD